MITVFCRECRRKLCNINDIHEDERAACPNCGSLSRVYHVTSKLNEDSIDGDTHTSALMRGRYYSVNIRISDMPQALRST